MSANGSKKVLIVEDDSVIRELCADVLGAAGYETDGAGDGAAGLEKIKKSHYDLIIADVYMPELGGISMYINAVWDNARLKERFLFMTGNTSEDAMAVIAQMNIKYLLKPFKVVDLLGCAESIMDRADLLDAGKFQNGKRTDVRFSLQKECGIYAEGAQDRPALRLAKTEDLSRNGLRVVYEGAPLKPQTPLAVSIKINSVSLRRSAKVVWSNSIDPVFSVSGLSFMRSVPVQSLSTELPLQ